MEAVLKKLQDRIQNNLHLKKVGGGAKFFGGARRGESVELASDLNSTDKDRQKNAVKRIIANMTLGRDVSQLFVDVVKLGQTFNVELKKLVYLYVLNTAKLQPDKALIAVNTFLRDTLHQSPIIRALAIRTMMCIRVDGVTEYTLEPLRRAVSDPDPYVRKTAAIGIGKLFHQSSKIFFEQNFVAELTRLLRDTFAIVSSNAAAVLAEVNTFATTPINMQAEWTNQLLNALGESSEWGQVYIMELLASVHPNSAEEAETLLQRITARISHTNPAVVMAAIKLIAVQGPRCSQEALAPYLTRVNSALLSLIKGDHETQFVVCRNVHMLLTLFPSLLKQNADVFYIRFTDPPYVKLEKLRLLLKLASEENAHAIVKELRVYAAEVDLNFVKEVVATIAAVAIKVDAVAPLCGSTLLEVLKQRADVLPEVVTASKNIVRKYPELLLLDTLLREYDAASVTDEDAKVSLIWMLGEFCDFVEDGPSLMESFVRDLLLHEAPVQLALLTAVVKIFLRNPAGMEATLSHTLETLATRSLDPDLRDRAYGYWRLLSKGIGVEKMKQIVHGQKPPVNVDRNFSDALTIGDLRLCLNTASAVFGIPYRSFLPPYGHVDEADTDEEEDEEITATAGEAPAAAVPAPTTAVKPTTSGNNFDNLFGDPTPVAAPVPAVAAPPAAAKPAAADPFESMFGAPSSASPAQPTTSQLPPQVVAGSATGGMAIHAQVTFDPPTLTLALVNHSPSTVSQLMLQVNTNSFGVVPASSIDSCMSSPFIAVGQTVSIVVPLRVADSHFNASKHVVEVGLKSSLGLHIFSLSPPSEQLLQPTPPMNSASFAQLWKSLDESAEAKQLLGDSSASTATATALKETLESHRCSVVAVRAMDDHQRLYGACRMHYGLSALFELVLYPKTPSMSYICCKSKRVNDVLPTVYNVVMKAFPAVVVATSAAKSNGADPFFW